MAFYVYVLISIATEKVFYVGKGSKNRLLHHRYVLAHPQIKEFNRGVYQRMRAVLNGSDFKEQKVFETTDEITALLKEQELIHFYGFENLVNTQSHAFTGRKLKPEVGQLIASKLRGRTMPPEVRAKISASNTGKQVSEETRLKLSESLSATFQGHFSEAHRQALRVPKTFTSESKHLRNEHASKTLKRLWDSGQITGNRGQKIRFKNPGERSRKISTAKKGVPVPLKRRLCISKTLTGRVNGPHSQETRTKISQALIGKTSPKRLESRRKRCQECHVISPEGQTFHVSPGEFYRFCEQHGLSGGNLGEVLRGRRTHHKRWTAVPTVKNSSPFGPA
jgi:hypothetical protein